MRTIILLILISTTNSYGQNIVGQTFMVKRDYHDAWLTFYPNNIYRFSSWALGRATADTGKYNLQDNKITFVSNYSDQQNEGSKNTGMGTSAIVGINTFQLKFISDTVLVQVDKEFKKYKTSQKTWRRIDPNFHHSNIKSYPD